MVLRLHPFQWYILEQHLIYAHTIPVLLVRMKFIKKGNLIKKKYSKFHPFNIFQQINEFLRFFREADPKTDGIIFQIMEKLHQD